MTEDISQTQNLKLPTFEPASQGERWWIKVNTAKEPSFPLESILSYPIPGKGELYFFRYQRDSETHKNNLIGRIAAKLPELEVSNWKDSNENSLFPDLPSEVDLGDTRYDNEVQKVLFSIIPGLTKRYQDNEAGELGKLYLHILETIEPKELMPYYKALNPDFFEWCERTGEIKKRNTSLEP